MQLVFAQNAEKGAKCPFFRCDMLDATPSYDEAAAKLAWQRTLDFFNKYLRG